MKVLTEKILKSGLIDKHTAALMEKYGILEEGATDRVNEHALEHATREQLIKLADELSDAADESDALRETALDLERLRWPTSVCIYHPKEFDAPPAEPPPPEAGMTVRARKMVAGSVDAVMDRMGRYYFRIQDVKKEWFVPGYIFERVTQTELMKKKVLEEVLEVQPLSIGEDVVCIQVSTRKVG